MGNKYYPDRWVIIEMTYPEQRITEKRVLAGWKGAYIEPDEWRMSSGITEIKEFDNRYEIDNHSGSRYFCFKARYGFTAYTAEIFEKYKKLQPELNFTVVEGYAKN